MRIHLFSNYRTCIDNSLLKTIQHGRLRGKAFAGTLILLVGQFQLLRLASRCSNICQVILISKYQLSLKFKPKIIELQYSLSIHNIIISLHGIHILTSLTVPMILTPLDISSCKVFVSPSKVAVNILIFSSYSNIIIM